MFNIAWFRKNDKNSFFWLLSDATILKEFFQTKKNGSSPDQADNVELEFKALASLVGSKNVTEISIFGPKNAIF